MNLTLGLLLVGICEELVFRGYVRAVLSRYHMRVLGMTLISAMMFGLIHWSDGLHQVLITAAIGAVYMLLYVLSGSLPALMLAHFMVHFIHYSKIIPDSLF